MHRKHPHSLAALRAENARQHEAFKQRWVGRSLHIVRLYRVRRQTIRQIAEYYGVGHSTIHRVLHWIGIPVRKRGERGTSEKDT